MFAGFVVLDRLKHVFRLALIIENVADYMHIYIYIYIYDGYACVLFH
jgi:hypothetical protein